MRDYEVDRLVSQYQKVKNIRKVALEFGISRTTVAKHLSNRGVETSRSMKSADIRQAKKLYADGLSSAAIGKQLGFDNKTVLKAVRS